MARRRDPDEPHDILAAEAFALGEGDRDLHREPAHDVLAAEAFAVPAADRRRHPGPRDAHSDDPEAHDVLSADEYAMPAAAHHSLPPGYAGSAGRSGSPWRGRLARAGLVVAGLALIRHRFGTTRR